MFPASIVEDDMRKKKVGNGNWISQPGERHSLWVECIRHVGGRASR